MNAGAVRQPRVDERTREIDAPAKWRDEPLNEHEDLLGVAEADGGLLKPTVAFDPHTACSVDHELGDTVIPKQRRQVPKPEQTIVEPPLERPELTSRDDDTLFDECLAQRTWQLVATRPAIWSLSQPGYDAAFDACPRRDCHSASIARSSASSS